MKPLAFCLVLVLVPAAMCQAAVILFEDNFNSGTLDPNKWSTEVDPSNSVSVVDGELKALWYGGAFSKKKAYAVSVPITLTLPDDWESIILSGNLKIPADDDVRGDYDMRLFDAGDPNNYVRATYYNLAGAETFRWMGPDSSGTLDRAIPTGFVDFELTVTRYATWSYSEDGSIVVERPSNPLADADAVQIKLGGMKGSFSASPDSVIYDNIMLVVTTIPEPAAFMVIAVGFAFMASRRRRR